MEGSRALEPSRFPRNSKFRFFRLIFHFEANVTRNSFPVRADFRKERLPRSLFPPHVRSTIHTSYLQRSCFPFPSILAEATLSDSFERNSDSERSVREPAFRRSIHLFRGRESKGRKCEEGSTAGIARRDVWPDAYRKTRREFSTERTKERGRERRTSRFPFSVRPISLPHPRTFFLYLLSVSILLSRLSHSYVSMYNVDKYTTARFVRERRYTAVKNMYRFGRTECFLTLASLQRSRRRKLPLIFPKSSWRN